MDALTVFIIAVVTFIVFVLLTAYFLKMAMLVESHSRKARAGARNESSDDLHQVKDEINNKE
ncbi:MAG: hypothetical protein SCH66_08880 [Methanolobus sp.]|nr:hypothetical protein [Methanolobus sp.]